jgi:hypothetical protein
MLHCNMNTSLAFQLRLDDLLAELQHARRNDELGRLALLVYCEVRGWARQANEPALAGYAGAMFTEQPHVSRSAFLAQVDFLITQLEQISQKYSGHRLAESGGAQAFSATAYC